MSAATCPSCRRWLRTIKPPAHLEGQQPDRLPFHRVKGDDGPICPGAGRTLPLHPSDGAA